MKLVDASVMMSSSKDFDEAFLVNRLDGSNKNRKSSGYVPLQVIDSRDGSGAHNTHSSNQLSIKNDSMYGHYGNNLKVI